jgi:hypothetical protein
MSTVYVNKLIQIKLKRLQVKTPAIMGDELRDDRDSKDDRNFRNCKERLPSQA